MTYHGKWLGPGYYQIACRAKEIMETAPVYWITGEDSDIWKLGSNTRPWMPARVTRRWK